MAGIDLTQIDDSRSGPRPAVMRMAAAMEEKLRRHDHDHGRDNWLGDNTGSLFVRLRGELEELEDSLEEPPEHAWQALDTMSECADVANFAMFIFDLLRDGRPEIQLPGAAILGECETTAIHKASFRAGWVAGWRRCVVQFSRMLTWASVNPLRHVPGMEMDLRAVMAAEDALDESDVEQLTIAEENTGERTT